MQAHGPLKSTFRKHPMTQTLFGVVMMSAMINVVTATFHEFRASGLLYAAEKAADEQLTEASAKQSMHWRDADPSKTLQHPHILGAAAMLPDGRVLAAGGLSLKPERTASSVAEIYDPVTCCWSLTAPMKQPRWSLDAIALDNGRILFAGGSSGFTPDGSLASAEVFDPTLNSFLPTENDLSGARHSSGLSRLADGRILVTGGCRLGNNLSGVGETAVDIYDPLTNRFTTAAPMSLGRTLHGQVTLRDGRVLVVGGAQKDAEIYDPAANQWKSSVGQLPTTLKDMKLFELHDGRILIAGGQNTVDGLTTDSVWYFNTETMEFSPGPSMQGFNYSPEGVQVGVSDYSAFDLFPAPHTSSGRYILFAGGENDPPTGPDVELHSSSVFDAINNRWIDLGPMAFIHDDHTESVLQISPGGQPQVLLFGGNSTMGSSRFELHPTALGLDGDDKPEETEPAKGE